MKILHISPYLPSLKANHAGGVCMGKQIETLEENHEVTVLSFIVTDYDRKIALSLYNNPQYHLIPLSKLQKIVNVITHPWYPAYFSTRSSFRFRREFIRLIKERNIEAIHAEYAAMGQYIWIKKAFPDIRFILTEHDFTEQSYIRKIENEKKSSLKKLFLKWQLLQIHFWEKRFCKNADTVITFNVKDQKLLQDSYGLTDIKIINPYYGETEVRAGDEPDKIQESICFVGQMGRPENYNAALRMVHIAKEVKKKYRNLQVYIIGSAPPEQLRNITDDWIHVTGFVDDIDQEIQKCRIGVFPLETGAGIKLKVLRCMALGLPVVTTDIGAEGIDEKGERIFLAQTDREFSNIIEKLLSDDNLVKYHALRGIAYVKEYFGWDSSRKVLEQIYSSD